MKLLSRKLVVPKPEDEALRILRSTANRYSKSEFAEGKFSFFYKKRYFGTQYIQIPIKGAHTSGDDATVVKIETHADFGFYVGCILVLVGVFGVFLSLASGSDRWIAELISSVIGFLLMLQTYWECRSYMEMLETKLLR